eukprot:3939697-Prymnesium_polylepis.1
MPRTPFVAFDWPCCIGSQLVALSFASVRASVRRQNNRMVRVCFDTKVHVYFRYFAAGRLTSTKRRVGAQPHILT